MKYCTHCGQQLEDDDKVCSNCGCLVDDGKNDAQVELQSEYEYQQASKSNGFAVAGFVLSFMIPLLGWIFGGIGLSKSKYLDGKGRNMALAAIIIASITFIINIFVLNSSLS